MTVAPTSVVGTLMTVPILNRGLAPRIRNNGEIKCVLEPDRYPLEMKRQVGGTLIEVRIFLLLGSSRHSPKAIFL